MTLNAPNTRRYGYIQPRHPTPSSSPSIAGLGFDFHIPHDSTPTRGAVSFVGSPALVGQQGWSPYSTPDADGSGGWCTPSRAASPAPSQEATRDDDDDDAHDYSFEVVGPVAAYPLEHPNAALQARLHRIRAREQATEQSINRRSLMRSLAHESHEVETLPPHLCAMRSVSCARADSPILTGVFAASPVPMQLEHGEDGEDGETLASTSTSAAVSEGAEPPHLGDFAEFGYLVEANYEENVSTTPNACPPLAIVDHQRSALEHDCSRTVSAVHSFDVAPRTSTQAMTGASTTPAPSVLTRPRPLSRTTSAVGTSVIKLRHRATDSSLREAREAAQRASAPPPGSPSPMPDRNEVLARTIPRTPTARLTFAERTAHPTPPSLSFASGLPRSASPPAHPTPHRLRAPPSLRNLCSLLRPSAPRRPRSASASASASCTTTAPAAPPLRGAALQAVRESCAESVALLRAAAAATTQSEVRPGREVRKERTHGAAPREAEGEVLVSF